jgi:hypothetical protein
MEEEGYIYEGEVVDTRGGYTYRDVMYSLEDGEYTFYENYYGARGDEFNEDYSDYRGSIIYDEDEIKELMSAVKEEEE